jgi:hypothetical protein
MEQDAKRGRLNMGIVMDASWGPQLASDMEETFVVVKNEEMILNRSLWTAKIITQSFSMSNIFDHIKSNI